MKNQKEKNQKEKKQKEKKVAKRKVKVHYLLTIPGISTDTHTFRISKKVYIGFSDEEDFKLLAIRKENDFLYFFEVVYSTSKIYDIDFFELIK